MVARVHFPKFSEAEYARRWRKIREAMEARQLDRLVIYGAYGSSFGSDPGQANLRYVTNFADQLHAYCVFPKRGEPRLLTSFVGHLATGREISAVTFERGETIVIEPNPCTPDLKFGVFLGDLCVVTENGAESLHTYPIDKPIVVEGF